MIFAASESNLPAHHETSGVFQVAPPTYLRVTLQHGFECIGFVQSREHVMSHGRNVSFAADIVCGWFEPESLELADRVAALEALRDRAADAAATAGPATRIIRRKAAGWCARTCTRSGCAPPATTRRRSWTIFFAFCRKLGRARRDGDASAASRRPICAEEQCRSSGQCRLNMLPLYDINMKGYQFGISAPSTIIFDMVLAGIPVAVWRDPARRHGCEQLRRADRDQHARRLARVRAGRPRSAPR